MEDDDKHQIELMHKEILDLRSQKKYLYEQIERLKDEKKALRNETILGMIGVLVSFSEE